MRFYPIAWIIYDEKFAFTFAYTSLIFYLYYLLISCFLLFLFRQQYILRKQNVPLTVLTSIFNGLAAVTLSLKLLLGEQTPPFVILWSGNFVYPSCLFLIVHARILHLLFEDDWHQIYIHEKEEKKNLFSPHNRKRRGVFVAVVAVLSFHFSTCLFLQHGDARWAKLIIFISLIFYVVVLAPWLLFRLQRIQDAYLMRNDLRWAIATGVPLLAFLSINWIPYPWTDEIAQLMPPLVLALASLFCVHSFIVVLPLLRALVWAMKREKYHAEKVALAFDPPPVMYYDQKRKKMIASLNDPSQQKPPRFDDALANPHFYQKFRRHMMHEFSSEMLLFQTESRDFSKLYQFADDQSAPSLPMLTHALHLYQRFISPGSLCQVRIGVESRRGIEEKLERREFDGMLFEEARREVYEQMERESYPRFIQSLSPLELEHFILHCGSMASASLRRSSESNIT